MTSISPVRPPAMFRTLAPALVLLAGALFLFRDTAAAMVAIWVRSDTFTHAFLVPPIVAWLVWRRRAALAGIAPRGEPWMLLPVAALCLLWLVSELAGVRAGTQFAFVALLVVSVPAIFGLAVARELAFPLAFAFFAVPVGEFLVPTMIDATADFTVAAVRLIGVPVYRDGTQFVIPSGTWSVVEACSGVRYLIASFMVGTLFAYLNFRSTRRRAVFMAASLVVPIVANWLRAFIIVMLGHFSDNRLAAGVDHLIYGWVFFGVVIGLLFLVGARWAEPEAPIPYGSHPGAASARRASSWWVGLAMVAGMLAVHLLERYGLPGDERPVAEIVLPGAPPGWTAKPGLLEDWQPDFKNARREAGAVYHRGERSVALWIGYYRDQGTDRKMVTSSNRLAEGGHKATWAQVSGGQARRPIGDAVRDVRTGVLRASAVPGLAASERRLRAWQVYWTGGRFVAGDAAATLSMAFERLLGRGDDAAVVVLATTIDPQRAPDPIAAADQDIAELAAALGPAIGRTLEATGKAP